MVEKPEKPEKPEEAGVLTWITDIRLPEQGVRDLAVKLALDSGRHVHLLEQRQVYCLAPRCIYRGEDG